MASRRSKNRSKRNPLSRVWAEKGSRPRLVQQQQYEYAYVFGAVCPTSGESVGVVLPNSNTESMNIHLAAISACVSEGRHAVVILDNAGWHHANGVCLDIAPNPTNLFKPA